MTFTLLVAQERTGLLAAASASRSLAVGNAVIAVDPAVGVVASQAWTNRELRARMLDAMDAGGAPSDVVARVPSWDEGAELRQVAALAPDGRGAARTGSETTPWAGALVRPGLIAVGNLLTGPEVLDTMLETFARLDGEADDDDAASAVAHLARAVVGAMMAGEDAGGDRRGRQSSAVIVTRRRPARAVPPELDLDLRVDDSPEPLRELSRLVERQIASFAESWPRATSAFERADGA